MQDFDMIDNEIKKLEIELVHSGFHDGWTAEWIKERLEHLREIKKQSGFDSKEDSLGSTEEK